MTHTPFRLRNDINPDGMLICPCGDVIEKFLFVRENKNHPEYLERETTQSTHWVEDGYVLCWICTAQLYDELHPNEED